YEGEQSTIYSGRVARSKSRYRAKVIAKLDAKISRTRKGNASVKSSRRRKKLIRAKNRATRRIDNQIRDIQHKQSCHLVSTLYNQGVQTVVIGDIRDIRKSMQYGKKANQKLHGWSFGKFRQMVKYKAERLGMQVKLMDEAYTSQTCPQCAERHKPRGRTYRCRCGFVCDRDAVGAMNIRAKYLDTFGKPVVGVMSPPVRGVRYKPCFPRHLALNTPRTPRL
uniref:RNA-guided endonuclease InsQ/TnpB family protein n=1 Tax=Deinococcus sp. TaxID=47478 RepID=UPI0025BC3543